MDTNFMKLRGAGPLNSDRWAYCFISECKQYTVSRSLTPDGWKYDAWFKRSAGSLAELLDGGLITADASQCCCEQHLIKQQADQKVLE